MRQAQSWSPRLKCHHSLGCWAKPAVSITWRSSWRRPCQIAASLLGSARAAAAKWSGSDTAPIASIGAPKLSSWTSPAGSSGPARVRSTAAPVLWGGGVAGSLLGGAQKRPTSAPIAARAAEGTWGSTPCRRHCSSIAWATMKRCTARGRQASKINSRQPGRRAAKWHSAASSCCTTPERRRKGSAWAP